jgi:DNA modification methylase
MIRLMQGDCLELMKDIPDGSIDMILCDLPYGVTQNKWDSIIPLDKLWEQYDRVISKGGIICLFAQTPFDKILGCSNLKMLKYEWIWEKTRATGHLNSKKMPMKKHENILVFFNTFSELYDTTDMFDGLKKYMLEQKELSGLSNKRIQTLLGNYMGSHYFTTKSQFTIPTEKAYLKLQETGFFKRAYEDIKKEYDSERNIAEININTYNPQDVAKKEVSTIRKGRNNGSNYGKSDKDAIQEFENYPRDILKFPCENGFHPTQKPVDLLEYLIKTYTNDGETVLDNCMGSGSTGVACVNTNRNFIGIELDENYFHIAEKRIKEAEAKH